MVTRTYQKKKKHNKLYTSISYIIQDDSDEILSELKRCQNELNSVATKNKAILQNLLQIMKTEFKRQQIKNQLKVVNSEVYTIYYNYKYLKY